MSHIDRIRTSYTYPDGDVIDLVAIKLREGVITVTDLGETLYWVRMQHDDSIGACRLVATCTETSLPQTVDRLARTAQAIAAAFEATRR